MRNLLKTTEQRILAGEELVLVTVVASSGATPRGAGARMLVNANGRIVGTIGGGAVEYRAEQIALQVLWEKSSLERDFALTRDDVQNLGMICGGAAQVFFHYIPAGDKATLSVVQEAIHAKNDLWLLSELAHGGRLSLHTRETAPQWLLPHLTRHPQKVQDFYVEQISSSGRVYIFGGGHVARELEPVLTHVGFRCVVLDDRPEFASRELFPTAEEVLCVDFSKLEDHITITSEDYVCIMTRGHAADTLVEAQVLRHHPRYNGMIGSRPKGAAVRKALREEYGYDDEAIAEIISPIGLPIGGETPAEIAISIAAQMIAARAEG